MFHGSVVILLVTKLYLRVNIFQTKKVMSVFEMSSRFLTAGASFSQRV